MKIFLLVWYDRAERDGLSQPITLNCIPNMKQFLFIVKHTFHPTLEGGRSVISCLCIHELFAPILQLTVSGFSQRIEKFRLYNFISTEYNTSTTRVTSRSSRKRQRFGDRRRHILSQKKAPNPRTLDLFTVSG